MFARYPFTLICTCLRQCFSQTSLAFFASLRASLLHFWEHLFLYWKPLYFSWLSIFYRLFHFRQPSRFLQKQGPLANWVWLWSMLCCLINSIWYWVQTYYCPNNHFYFLTDHQLILDACRSPNFVRYAPLFPWNARLVGLPCCELLITVWEKEMFSLL